VHRLQPVPLETSGYYAGVMINDMLPGRVRAGRPRLVKLLKNRNKSG